MLSGRYPSDEFAELRPRITWDRIRGTLTARPGAKRIAIVNGGTIPDRGLYGVFLAGGARERHASASWTRKWCSSRGSVRPSCSARRPGVSRRSRTTASSSPAPGEPGKMPFWHGDRPGRPLELGLAIGRLVRELRGMPRAAAVASLMREHALDRAAAESLTAYLAEQEGGGMRCRTTARS